MALTLSSAAPDFELSLRAANKAPRTVEAYTSSLAHLADFLAGNGRTTDLGKIKPSDIERWTVAQQDAGASAATISLRWRAVRQFWRWAIRESEVDVDPMAQLQAPHVPIKPVPVIDDQAVAALLKVCKGTDFVRARDTAVIRLLLDTGIRRAELIGLTIDDVDRAGRTVTVMGKGRRSRTVRYGIKTAEALSRYLRRRADHRHAASTRALWLPERGSGAWGTDGVRIMLRRRSLEAGLPAAIHPHQFRHTMAADYLASGGLEGDLMRVAGWSSRSMLDRYGAAVADDRARDARDRLELKGDRL
jgi:integrase/recombinase XerC